MPDPSKPVKIWLRCWRWLAPVLCLFPPIVLANLIRRNAVNVPNWDEWDDDVAGLFVKLTHGHLSFGDLWVQHNESRLVVPRLIYLALGYFTHWNLCYEMAFTFLLACVSAGLIFLLGRRIFSEYPMAQWLIFFISSMLIFSPAQYQIWLWGMELIMYLPLVCILASLWVWQTNLNERTKIWICASLAVIGTYSFSNGFLVWIVLFPVLFISEGCEGLRKRGWATLGWAGGFLVNVTLYFHHYHMVRYLNDGQIESSSGVWRQLWHNPWAFGEYLFTFLGAPLVNQDSDIKIETAVVLGSILIILFLITCILLFPWKKNTILNKEAWPWLTLGSYGILSALLAAIGRSWMGPQQAMSSRYTIFGICLTITLTHLIPLIVFKASPTQVSFTDKHFRTATPLLFILGLCVITLHCFAFPASVLNFNRVKLNRLHAKSCLKFLNVLPPQPPTTAILYPDLTLLHHMANALNRCGWFNYPLLQTNLVSDFTQRPPPKKLINHIDICRQTDDEVLLRGWTLSAADHAPADCVLFSYESTNIAPTFFALFDQRLIRPDLAKQMHDQAYLYAGWEKTITLTNLPKAELLIRLWDYDVDDDSVTPLPAKIKLNNN